MKSAFWEGIFLTVSRTRRVIKSRFYKTVERFYPSKANIPPVTVFNHCLCLKQVQNDVQISILLAFKDI